MKKILLTLALGLFSVVAFSQVNTGNNKEITDGPFSKTITQKDLPIGKTFVVVPLDGTTAFSGKVDSTTINVMPRTSFVLKVEGEEIKKFDLPVVEIKENN